MNKMLSIKTIILALIAISFLASCSKKEGCNFNEALNYDNEVVIDDGSCTFTNFTFYADSIYVNGSQIRRVDVKIGNEVIGNFVGAEDIGSACGGPSTVSYSPPSVANVSWTSEIHLADTVIVTSGESRTSPGTECLEINVLP